MWSYCKIELSTFFTNKKNIAIYVLLICAAVFYAIKLAPAYDPIEKVDYAEIEARYLTRQEFLDSLEGRDLRRVHPSVRYAAEAFVPWNEMDQARMDALKTNDLIAYAKATSDWYGYTDWNTYRGGNFYYNPRYYTYGNLYAHEEGHLAYLAAAFRYTGYSELDRELTVDIFEERTALQTFQRLMDDYLPFVFYIGCLLLTVDIVVQDRRHPTLLRGYPLADWKKLLAKSITAFIGSVALFVPFFAGLVIIGIQSGFGSFDLPVPVYVDQSFTNITMGTYFAKTGSLILAWFAVLIGIVILFSVLLRNEFINILAGFASIAAEFLYFDRGYGYFKPIENYPTSYTQVGGVVTNIRNYLYESSGIVWSKGMLLLLACTCFCFILALIISLSKRYKLVK